MLSRAIMVVALLLSSLGLAGVAPANSGGATDDGFGNAIVGVDKDGKRVTAGGTEESEGSPDDSYGDSEWVAEPPRTPPLPLAQFPEQCMGNSDRVIGNSINCFSPPTGTGEEQLPSVTITDLVSFVPTSVSVVGEPGNVGVAGRATNFVSDAATTVVGGTLFNRALSVQFTPTSFVFDYGDGTVSEVATGGASWASLGLAQFTPTDTSHVYAKRGMYDVSLTVNYSAHIDFGTGWLLVPGTVTGPPSTQSIQIYEARNMLVSQTCDENPKGIGC